MKVQKEEKGLQNTSEVSILSEKNGYDGNHLELIPNQLGYLKSRISSS